MTTSAEKEIEVLSGREINVSTQILREGGEAIHFRVSREVPLLDVMIEGARRVGVTLLPNTMAPLDRLWNLRGHEIREPIGDLQQQVGEYVRLPHASRHFGIELVLAFRVNTWWAVAPRTDLSPREILALPEIQLDYTQYTLYKPGSTEPLPIDTPVAIERGMAFEAQRDGRYGREA